MFRIRWEGWLRDGAGWQWIACRVRSGRVKKRVGLLPAHGVGLWWVDRVRHAGIEKLPFLGAVEIAVEIGGIVQDLDIAVQCCAPVDESHNPSKIHHKDRQLQRLDNTPRPPPPQGSYGCGAQPPVIHFTGGLFVHRI